MKKCMWHICMNSAREKSSFCSLKCKNKHCVTQRRQELKQLAFEYKGSKCNICAYDKCIWALEFHHLDQTQKDFNISKNGHTRSWERIQKELDKCIMVCANCHREIHAGFIKFC